MRSNRVIWLTTSTTVNISTGGGLDASVVIQEAVPDPALYPTLGADDPGAEHEPDPNRKASAATPLVRKAAGTVAVTR